MKTNEPESKWTQIVTQFKKIIIEELLYCLQNLGNYSNTVQNWWRDPHIRNRRENPETDQYKYLQLTFDKNAKAMIMEDG